MFHLKEIGNLLPLIDPTAPGHSPVDLLKGHQIRARFLNDRADSIQIDSSVAPPAVMNVVRHHGQKPVGRIENRFLQRTHRCFWSYIHLSKIHSAG